MDSLLQKKYISSKEASEMSGYHSDYLARLCRSGVIVGSRVGRTWVINKDSLQKFVTTQEAQKKKNAERLAHQREKDYRAAKAARESVQKAQLVATKPAEPILSPLNGTFPSFLTHPSVAALVALLVVFSGLAGAQANLLPTASKFVVVNIREIGGNPTKLASGIGLESLKNAHRQIGEGFIALTDQVLDAYIYGIEKSGEEVLALGIVTRDSTSTVNAPIDAWVAFSNNLVPKALGLVYGVGDLALQHTNAAPTRVAVAYDSAVETWVTETAALAEAGSRKQIALGKTFGDVIEDRALGLVGNIALAYDTSRTALGDAFLARLPVETNSLAAVGSAPIAQANAQNDSSYSIASGTNSETVERELSFSGTPRQGLKVHGASTSEESMIQKVAPAPQELTLIASATLKKEAVPAYELGLAAAGSAPAHSSLATAGENVALYTYLTIRDFFHRTGSALASLFAPRTIVINNTTTLPSTTEAKPSIAALISLVPAITNVNNYFQLEGVSYDVLERKLAELRRQVSNDIYDSIDNNNDNNSGGGGSGSVTSVDISGGSTGFSFAGGPVTSTGTFTLSGTLSIANGGTGITTAPAYGELMVGDGLGGYTLLATSSLGIGAGSGLPGGANTQVQFNNAGLFAGDSGLTYNAGDDRLTTTYASTSALTATDLFATNFTLGSLSGVLKATAGVVSVATAGVDYENILSFAYPLVRSGNSISLAFGTTTANTWSSQNIFSSLFATNASSTNATTTNFGINGETFTDLTGTGLTNSGGVLTLNASGNWTGTFDGQEGTYYLDRANHTGTQLASTISDFSSTVNAFLHGSTTVPKTYTANTFTQSQSFTGGVAIGSLNGPLQANNGTVSATTSIGVLYGGTGLTSAPTYGQVLLGNASGGYTLTATSSLGITSGGGTLTAVGPAGQTQTGPTITFATSSSASNGLTPSLVITGSGNTITYTSSLSGTLNNAGLTNSTVSYGGVSLSLGGSDATPAFDLTDATNLPVATGISGLGSGVATFLANPSSVNFATALTGETGSGAVVFGTSPSISGAILTGITSISNASTSAFSANTLAVGGTGTTTISLTGALTTPSLTVGSLSGLLKATAGLVSVATAGTDYENVLSFAYPLVRSVNNISLAFGTTTANTWSAQNIFSSLFATNASSTNATTTNLHITSVTSGGLSADANGRVYSAATTTAGTGLTYSGNAFNVNTSQNISTLSNLTSNGLVTTSGGTGALSVTVPGTGVLTALGTNVGSAGSFVVNGGALGTPSSGTLTNATGLPIIGGTTGTLSVARGGTGTTTAPAGQVLYGGGDGVYRSVATTSATIGAGLSYSGTFGTLLGGIAGTLSLNATGDWTGTFDGQEGTYYLSRANHTGTQLASTISDFASTARALFSGSAPLAYDSGTGTFSITQANGSTDGYLSSTDWNIFNNKLGSYDAWSHSATYGATASATTSPLWAQSGLYASSTVAFGTAGNDLYFNSTNGNLGLGTASPGQKLTIFQGNLFFGDSSNTAYGITFQRGGTQRGTITTANGDLTFNSNSGATSGIRFTTNGVPDATLMLLNTSGNVGVGTSSPYAKLSVTGSAGGTSDIFAVSTSTSGYATTTVARIDANGNAFFGLGGGKVGVGISAPQQTLDVSGAIRATNGNLEVYDTANSPRGVTLYRNSTNLGGFNTNNSQITFYAASGHDLNFTVNSSTLTAAVVKDVTGNFGIGTSSPFTKLGVAGDAYIGGSLTATGTAAVSGLATFSSGVNVNGETITDLTGTGLTNSGGSLTVSTSGDWTGTFDGQEGSYYLARANHTGTQLASTISDFNSSVASYISGSSTVPHIGGTSYGDMLSWTGSAWGVRATSSLGIALTDTTGTLAQSRGGTGITTYTAGDILYADGGGNLAKLPIGSAGQVLKVTGGLPQWGVDLTTGGGGGAGAWSTTTDSLAIYPTDTSDVVIIGNSATSTLTSIFEVSGRSYFSNTVGIATTAPATAYKLSVGGSGLFSGDLNAANLITAGNANVATLTVGSLNGLLKAASGVVSAASAGVDYENPLTFAYPLVRTVNAISLAFGTTTANTWGAQNTFTGIFATNASSTNATTTNLGINSETFTDLTGSGLQNVGGALTLNATGDWTGTFDGQEGSYYLSRANHTGTQLASTISDFSSAVNSFIHASTTIAKTYSSNTFAAGQTFNGGVTVGTLNGPLQANAGVVSATTSIGVLYGGTGLTSAPTYGQLLLGNASGGYTLTATSSLGLVTSAVTAIGPAGQTQTGPTVLQATSTSAFNGLTPSLTITGSGNTLTYTSALSGTLGVGGGGTGATSFTAGQLLYGSGSGALQSIATSSATCSSGVSCTSFTVVGAVAPSITNTGVLSITGTANQITASAGTGAITLSIPSQFNISNASTTNFSANTLAVGGTATTSISSAGVLTTVRANATYASTTGFSSSYASSTSGFFGSLSIASLTGVLKATAGAVSTGLVNLASEVSGILPTANGGTGWGTLTANTVLLGNGSGAIATTSAGTNGQVLALVGGVPTWVATSSINNGVSSIAQTSGSAQTGAITFGTSSATSNGVTIGLNITNTGGAFTLTPSRSGILSVAGGGTGQNTFSSGQLVYGNGTNALTSIATSSLAVGSEFSYSGTLGALVGGTGGTLTVANNGLSLGKLATIAANTLLGNPTGATGNVQAFATSSLGIAISDTTGTLSIARGGTGSTTAPQGQILYGGASSYQSVATSSVVIGSGLSYSGTFGSVVGGAGGTLTLNTSGDWTGTFDGQEGSYYLSRANHTGTQLAATISDFSSAVNAFIHASTTIPKTYTSNTFTGGQTFSGAVTIGSLNGPLQANAGVVSATTSIGVLYGGTGLTSAPTYGQVLLGNASGGYTLTATSSLGLVTSAVTAIGPAGQTQTGPTVIQSTSTSAFNGLTPSLTITGSGNTLTYTSALSGTLGVGGGGTGASSFTAGQLIYGSGSGALQSIATSSATCSSGVSCTSFTVVGSSAPSITNSGVLSITGTANQITASAGTGAITLSIPSQFNISNASTTNFSANTLAVGGTATTSISSAGVLTTVRANATYASTTGFSSGYASTTIFGINGEAFTDLTGTGLQNIGGALTLNATGDWTGTFDGQEGTYYLSRANHTGTQLASTISDFSSEVQAFIHASTTIPKTYTANTFTGGQTFNGAVTIGSLNGPLQANAGVVSATTSIGVLYGGTGLTSAPTYGQLLLGNASGGYTLTATSSLGLVTSAVTAIGPAGQTQTGPTVTMATSTSANNGLTPNLVVTGSGNTLTYTSSLSGTLTNAGLQNSTVSYGGVTLSLGASDATPAFDLTDATNLPVATGISGLGSGVAAFLATPSSANLATAVTGETGSGALVFGTAPTISGSTLTGITSISNASTSAFSANTLAVGGTGTTTISLTGALTTPSLTVGSLSGLLKATAGLVSVATAGTDYENVLSFAYPLVRSVNSISLAFGTTTANTWSAQNIFSSLFATNASSTNATTTNLGINSETFTDLTGTGLQRVGGALTLNATGDWTGTFDGQEGTYYLARGNHTGTQLASTISDFSSTARGLFSGSAPLAYDSGTGTFSIAQANGSTNGYLSSTDWNTFNNKLGSYDAWSHSATYGATASATTSPLWAQSGLYASSTVAFGTAGNDLYFNATNGRLGIGTTTPAYKLQVQDSSNVTVAQFGASSALYLMRSYPGIGFNTYYNGGYFYGQGSSNQYAANLVFNNVLGQLNFGVTSSTGNADAVAGITTRMTLTSSGYLGIGTTSPYAKLSVWGANTTAGIRSLEVINSASTTVFAVDNAGNVVVPGSSNNYIGSNSGHGLRFDGSGVTGISLNSLSGAGIIIDSDSDSSTNDFWIGRGGTDPDSVSAKYFTVANGGNVGIGTTSPFTKLGVAGDAYIGGNLTATGTAAVSGLATFSSGINVNGETFTDLTGTGLQNVGGALTLNATGDWTGTFDGQEGTYYLDRANHTGTQLASTISDFSSAVNSFIHASTTIPKTYTASTFTNTQTFSGGVTVGSLNGPLQANAGVVSATTSIGVLYGGTGLTSAPTYGQLLVGNASGGYTLTATSSLGISATPGGSDTQVQYNNNGSFGGDSGLTYNATADRVTTSYASTTGISSTYASSTSGFFGSLSVGSLSGFLKATAGSVAAALVDLTSDVTGTLPIANGGTGATTLNDLITLGSHTTGDYVATVSGNSQIGVSGVGAENATAALSINADSIGDSELAFDTGQALTSASSPTFSTLTLSTSLISPIITANNSSSNSNFRVGSATGVNSQSSAASLLFAGASNVQQRVFFNGTTATTLTSNAGYGGVIFGAQPVTEGTSGTHPVIAGVAINAPVITNGSAVTTDATSLYIAGAPSGITPTNTATSLWVDTGIVRIDDTLGIGTSTPWQELSVAGDISLTGRLYDSAASAGTNGMVLLSTGSATTWVATSSLGISASGGLTSYDAWAHAATYGATASATTSPLWAQSGLYASSTVAFGTAGLDAYFNSSTGRFGIGTSAPTYSLSVLGNATSQNGNYVAQFARAGGSGGIRIGSNNGAAILGAVSLANSSQELAFNVMNSGVDTEVLRITSSGFVGIGTTTPSGLFSIEQGTEASSFWIGNSGSSTPSFVVNGVNGNGRVGIGTSSPLTQLDITASDVPNTGAGIQATFFGSGNTRLNMRRANGTVNSPTAVVAGDRLYVMNGIGFDGTTFITGAQIIADVEAGATVSSGIVPTFMGFKTMNSSGSLTENLRISAAGNVGIGTSSPAAKLSVVGVIRSAMNFADIELVADSGSGFRWALDGSNNLLLQGTTNTFSSVSVTPISFLTNGNVGISTSSPWQELSVSGDLSLTGRLYDSAASAGTNGMVLLSTGSATTWVATSSLGITGGGGGITAVGPTGQTQTGPTLTLATTTTAFNGLTSNLKITGSTNTLTFAPTLSGTLGVAGGGTGAATFTGGLLVGNGTSAIISRTLTGNSQITVTNGTGVSGNPTLSITADSIGDSQLAFDTGQNLTTASTPTFSLLTTSGANAGITFNDRDLSGAFILYDSGDTLRAWNGATDVLTLTSAGNLAAAGSISALDNNLFICTGGACPTGSPTGNGNIIAETSIGVGTSTPWAGLAVVSGKAIVVAENALATSTSMTVNWQNGNQQLVRIGTAGTTISFSGYIEGQKLVLTVCNPNATAGAISWGTQILWSGGTAPSQTTTANKCDIWSFLATTATSTLKIFGAQSANF